MAYCLTHLGFVRYLPLKICILSDFPYVGSRYCKFVVNKFEIEVQKLNAFLNQLLKNLLVIINLLVIM